MLSSASRLPEDELQVIFETCWLLQPHQYLDNCSSRPQAIPSPCRSQRHQDGFGCALDRMDGHFLSSLLAGTMFLPQHFPQR
jgi:hypothetical protein